MIQATKTPTSEANKARINAFYNGKTGNLIVSLAMRWADESGYEDIAEYKTRIERELPEGFAITKMTKRPFGFHFTIGTEATYFIKCTSNGAYSWGRVA